MPRLPINYDNTKFYKIVCRDLDVKELYVGHTTDFNRRKASHKHRCITEGDENHNNSLYVHIRLNGGWSNFDMILIETRFCANALEARKTERSFIESLNASLNKVIPTRSKQEYRNDTKEHMKSYIEVNKEVIAQQQKQYKQRHKEEISQWNRTYNETHKEHISQRRKQYNEAHQEHNILQSKIYYEANKALILSKQKISRANKK
jgi:hypothetical protein